MFDLEKFGARLKECRLARGLSQEELGKRVGYTSRSAINKVEMGFVDITQSKIEAFATALDVPIAYLMGWTDTNSKSGLSNLYGIENIYPLEKPIRLPVYNEIAAGTPICTDQSPTDEWIYEDQCFGNGEFFVLRVKGDSMSPTITDGSFVILHKQNVAEKGQIVACLVNSEYATLKRFIPRADGFIMLQADNPAFESFIVPKADFDNGDAIILGVVKEAKRHFD